MNTPKDRIIFEHWSEIPAYITNAIAHAEAHEETSIRLSEAHDYVRTFCMPEGWGRNVWHTILDDAIKLRKELNKIAEG